MNEVLRRRLVGLAMLLVMAFLLSLLLPGAPAREEVEPSTTVSLSGEVLQVTEADAVPPPDDYIATPSSSSAPAPGKPPAPEVAISDLSGVDHPEPKPAEVAAVIKPPTPTPQTAANLRLAQQAAKPKPEPEPAAAKPKPEPEPAAAKPKPEPEPAVAKPKSPVAVPSPAPAKPTVSEPAPRPKLPEVVAKPVKPEPAEKTVGQSWFVQIGSFADAGTASTIVSLIRRQGYHGEVTTITGAKGKTLNRVRAGPYSSEVEARGVQARIATQGYPQARVVVEGSR